MRTCRILRCRRPYILPLLSCLFALSAAFVGSARAADTPLRHRGRDWKPRKIKGATLHARVPFLQQGRDWERVDIYVPKDAGEERLPCLIAVYGGGYGDKVSPLGQIAPAVRRGYVLAMPDYALQLSSPPPLTAWDVANAIRFLRNSAARYNIDPERIGVIGWSAGGWIVQNLCYSGHDTLFLRREQWNWNRTGKTPPGAVPFLQPRPLYADQSVKVQAVVSDWGAGKLVHKKRNHRTREVTRTPAPRLSPDDPPLMTCFPGKPREIPRTSIGFLRDLGVPAEPVFMPVKSTHVPKFRQESWTADGTETTWGEAIYDFCDRYVKHPTVSTAPEIRPVPSPGASPVRIRMLSAHPTGAIHYTVDGTAPTTKSPVYTSPIELSPGATVKAIAVRKGLAPSRAATFTLDAESPRPYITTETSRFTAKVGQPFKAAFQAEGGDVRWYACGRLGEQYRHFGDRRFNPPRHIPWMRIDPATGVLYGTPRRSGVYPVIVSAWTMTGQDWRRRGDMKADARLVIVTVQER